MICIKFFTTCYLNRYYVGITSVMVTTTLLAILHSRSSVVFCSANIVCIALYSMQCVQTDKPNLTNNCEYGRIKTFLQIEYLNLRHRINVHTNRRLSCDQLLFARSE
jgi:hypothetical protein